MKEAAAASTSSSETAPSHPILGPVVADLGYKRIHFVPAAQLSTIAIWEKQRIYRNDRAISMAKEKAKAMQLGFPGVICLHEDEAGKLCVIDGQHRIGMMAWLQQQRQQQEDSDDSSSFDNVLVEVYTHLQDEKDHKKALFLEINKAEPVKLVDMPGVAKAGVRNVITGAVDKLQEAYPKMFSPSQKCRTPNVNVDNLRDSLFASDVMKRHKLTTTTKLYNWILEQNEKMEDKYNADLIQDPTFSPPGWKKAKANKFYLGLDSAWLYN